LVVGLDSLIVIRLDCRVCRIATMEARLPLIRFVVRVLRLCQRGRRFPLGGGPARSRSAASCSVDRATGPIRFLHWSFFREGGKTSLFRIRHPRKIPRRSSLLYCRRRGRPLPARDDVARTSPRRSDDDSDEVLLGHFLVRRILLVVGDEPRSVSNFVQQLHRAAEGHRRDLRMARTDGETRAGEQEGKRQ